MISPDSIQRIKDVDITDIIGAYPEVALKQKGNSWKGCCPFHNEKTPSFSVTPSKNIYKCFGCGAGGDGIKFVMQHDKLDFIEAIEKIAQIANIQLEYTEDNEAYKQERVDKKSLREALNAAQVVYQEQLYKDVAALDYVQRRGYDADTIALWGIGYAPDEWHYITDNLQRKGLKDAGIKAGILSKGGKGQRPVPGTNNVPHH